MILFIILLIALLCVGIVSAFAVGVGGIAFLLTFGDVIVCVFLIVLIVKHLMKKHGK